MAAARWTRGGAAAVMMAVMAAAAAQGQGTPAKKPMRTFDTPHYTLTTDIAPEYAREADLRMTRMFEEYRRRTASFSNDFQGKFLFQMFERREDYTAAGGMAGSAGQFGGGRLMAIAGTKSSASTWHVVQHEGFHQFAAMTIRARMPTWLNEGLADFFGEAVFTGDNFVSGVIPPYRLKMVKKGIEEKKWKPFQEMMTMSPQEWSGKLSYENYTQAWAMVHFLARGENDKYQQAFSQYINLMNRGTSPVDAWANVFGKDSKGFQEKCEKWWLGLPDDPTSDLMDKAVVQSVTSILARSELQGQKFENFEEFAEKARPTDMKLNRDMWLPPEFVENAMKRAKKVGTWTLEPPKTKGQMPRLVCVTADGVTYTGAFVLQGKRVGQVAVQVEKAGEKSGDPKAK